jgi:hypothetical protein
MLDEAQSREIGSGWLVAAGDIGPALQTLGRDGVKYEMTRDRVYLWMVTDLHGRPTVCHVVADFGIQTGSRAQDQQLKDKVKHKFETPKSRLAERSTSHFPVLSSHDDDF